MVADDARLQYRPEDRWVFRPPRTARHKTDWPPPPDAGQQKSAFIGRWALAAPQVLGTPIPAATCGATWETLHPRDPTCNIFVDGWSPPRDSAIGELGERPTAERAAHPAVVVWAAAHGHAPLVRQRLAQRSGTNSSRPVSRFMRIQPRTPSRTTIALARSGSSISSCRRRRAMSSVILFSHSQLPG